MPFGGSHFERNQVRSLVIGSLLQPPDNSFVMASSLSSSPTLHDFSLIIVRYMNSSFQKTSASKWKEWSEFLDAGGIAIIWNIDDSIQRHSEKITRLKIPSLVHQEGDRIRWAQDSYFANRFATLQGARWHAHLVNPNDKTISTLGWNGAGSPVAFEIRVGNGIIVFLPEFERRIASRLIRKLIIDRELIIKYSRKKCAMGTVSGASLKVGGDRVKFKTGEANLTSVNPQEDFSEGISQQDMLIIGSLASFFSQLRGKINARKLAITFGFNPQLVEDKKKAEIISILLRRGYTSSRVALKSVIQGLIEIHTLTESEITRLNSLLDSLCFTLKSGTVEDVKDSVISPIPTEEQTKRRYDVAISYAREDLCVAEEIKRECGEDISVFLDRTYDALLWGKDLSEWFHGVYGSSTRFVLILVSKHYTFKNWTDFEFSIARQEARKRKQEFILPVRLDDTPLQGLKSTVKYLDYNQLGAKEIVRILKEKIYKGENE